MGGAIRYGRSKPSRKKIVKPQKDPKVISLIGGKRFHTKVTPAIKKIAENFPGNNAATVKQIANFVFNSTWIKETVFNRKKRHARTAEEVLKQQHVDLLHCYDRSHALISILTAKNIPSWTVISIDYAKFVHSYVEALIGEKIYTIAFRPKSQPIFSEGRCENTISHNPGTSFVRARELADFGVRDTKTFNVFAEKLFLGQLKDKIQIR